MAEEISDKEKENFASAMEKMLEKRRAELQRSKSADAEPEETSGSSDPTASQKAPQRADPGPAQSNDERNSEWVTWSPESIKKHEEREKRRKAAEAAVKKPRGRGM